MITNTQQDYIFYMGDLGSPEITCIVDGNPKPDVISWSKLPSDVC